MIPAIAYRCLIALLALALLTRSSQVHGQDEPPPVSEERKALYQDYLKSRHASAVALSTVRDKASAEALSAKLDGVYQSMAELAKRAKGQGVSLLQLQKNVEKVLPQEAKAAGSAFGKEFFRLLSLDDEIQEIAQAAFDEMQTKVFELIEPVLLTPRNTGANPPVTTEVVVQASGVEPLELPADFKGHESEIVAIKFSPNNQWVAAAEQQQVRIWETATGITKCKIRIALPDRNASITNLAMSPAGDHLAIGTSYDGHIHLWSLAQQKWLYSLQLPTLSHAIEVCFSPDGKTLAAELNRVVYLFDTATGDLQSKPDDLAGSGSVACLAIAPQGKWIAAVTSPKYGESVLQVVDRATGKSVWRNEDVENPTALSFRDNGQNLVVYDHDAHELITFQTVDGKEVQRFKVAPRYFTKASFSADGAYFMVAASSEAPSLYSTSTGKLLRTFDRKGGGGEATAISSDGELAMIVTSNYTLRLWNIEEATSSEPPRLLHTLAGHTDLIYGLTFAADNRTLLSASSDNTVRVWNAVEGKQLRTFENYDQSVRSVSVLPGDRSFMAVSGGKARIHDMQTGDIVSELPGERSNWRDAAMVPNSKQVLAGGADSLGGAATLFSLAEGKPIKQFLHNDEFSDIAVSPTGTHAATGGSNVTIWDIETGRVIASHAGFTISNKCSLDFSPDGNFLAAVHSSHATVTFWDTRFGEVKRELKIGVHGIKQPSALAYSPRGNVLAVAVGNKIVFLRTGSGDEFFELEVSDKVVLTTAICFSTDGTRLAAAGTEETIKLWDVSSITQSE